MVPVVRMQRLIPGPGQRLIVGVREDFLQLRRRRVLGRRGIETRTPVAMTPTIAQRLFPDHPGQARFLGLKRFGGKTHRHREPVRALAHQHDVIGLLHHQLGDFRGSPAAADGADGSTAARGAVHDAGIELGHAVFIRQPAVSDRGVFRIELLNIDAGDDRVERIGALLHHVHGALSGSKAVRAGDDDRLSGSSPGLPHKILSGIGEGGAGDEEIATSDHIFADPFRNTVATGEPPAVM